MAKQTAPADQSAGKWEVTLSARFEHLGFWYMPGHKHEVNKDIFDAMTDAGVIADVKQLS